jgi:tRNA pseudouridine55 synthase
MARNKKGLTINGIINLDKPLGLSSNQALQKVKYLLNAKKAGHTGSLDPLASGVLPLCFGHATKVSSLLLDSDKRYHAGIFLGHRTTTGDKEGDSIGPISHNVIDIQEIVQVLKQFTGKQQQLPPMYSALKFEGQPLYKLARKGIDIERDTREIIIHSINVINYQYPELLIDVSCSKGTYIRSLAEDIGNVLECGAHLYSLRRVQAGDFLIENSYTLKQLAELKQQQNIELVLDAPDMVLRHLPKINLNAQQAEDIRMGRKICIDNLELDSFDFTADKLKEQQVRIYEQDSFLGLAQLLVQSEQEKLNCFLQPKRLFC